MPGPMSDQYQGPGDETPYVPSWCYESGPRMCKCGHHEGYHSDDGICLLKHKCKCSGASYSTPNPGTEQVNKP